MPRSPRSRPSEVAGKPEKIPRPPNAWIIYRTDRLNEWKDTRGPNDPPVKQADISRMIGTRWRFEADHVKLEYEKRAAIAKAEHKRKYPNYKYNPISRRTTKL
ncbi:HMG-box [Lentinus tigrinus ALCF2SS1-6]|uniref:HMG-box n=1 Tax=Lentinus tigrinus ALCF2SS1-6 TaxID=1328759 RepID=A0A5C2SJF4_9APHY|nr:HMG-box [Lentinus tigrinus ALCF2SS1-6]